jgi:hypothetical protein
MNLKAEDTDLSEAEWMLKSWIPSVKPGDLPRRVNIREILNAVF